MQNRSNVNTNFEFLKFLYFFLDFAFHYIYNLNIISTIIILEGDTFESTSATVRRFAF